MKVLEAKGISQAVIGRLPRYFRYLGELKDEGVERISSQELSGLMKVTASQIRQDFNNFGGFGQQVYGYNVEYLYREIGKIFGLKLQHNFYIIKTSNQTSCGFSPCFIFFVHFRETQSFRTVQFR